MPPKSLNSGKNPDSAVAAAMLAQLEKMTGSASGDKITVADSASTREILSKYMVPSVSDAVWEEFFKLLQNLRFVAAVSLKSKCQVSFVLGSPEDELKIDNAAIDYASLDAGEREKIEAYILEKGDLAAQLLRLQGLSACIFKEVGQFIVKKEVLTSIKFSPGVLTAAGAGREEVDDVAPGGTARLEGMLTVLRLAVSQQAKELDLQRQEYIRLLGFLKGLLPVTAEKPLVSTKPTVARKTGPATALALSLLDPPKSASPGESIEKIIGEVAEYIKYLKIEKAILHEKLDGLSKEHGAGLRKVADAATSKLNTLKQALERRLGMLSTKIEALSRALSSLRMKVEPLNSALTAKEAEIKRLTAEIETFKIRIPDLERRAEQAKQASERLQKEVEEVASLRSKVTAVLVDNTDLTRKLEAVTGERVVALDTVGALTARLAQTEVALAAEIRAREAAEMALARDALALEIASLRAEINNRLCVGMHLLADGSYAPVYISRSEVEAAKHRVAISSGGAPAVAAVFTSVSDRTTGAGAPVVPTA